MRRLFITNKPSWWDPLSFSTRKSGSFRTNWMVSPVVHSPSRICAVIIRTMSRTVTRDGIIELHRVSFVFLYAFSVDDVSLRSDTHSLTVIANVDLQKVWQGRNGWQCKGDKMAYLHCRMNRNTKKRENNGPFELQTMQNKGKLKDTMPVRLFQRRKQR